MKIVTYNLHFGGKKDANLWQEMLQNFLPSIVFAQESFDPKEYFSEEQFSQLKGCVWRNVPERKWGSGIVSMDYSLEEVSLGLPEYDGWVVGARINALKIGETMQSVLLFNIHAPSPGPYEPHVDKIISEIARQYGRFPMIVAGDFNLTTAVRHKAEALWSKKDSTKEKMFQDKLRKQLGIFNAWQVLNPNQELCQTLRWNRNPVPAYHCDAIFMSGHLLAHLDSVNVESTGIWSALSDHNPVVATFQSLI